jgi:small subunit ribosomal protein S20
MRECVTDGCVVGYLAQTLSRGFVGISTSAARRQGAFVVEAKQNKEARAKQVRLGSSLTRCVRVRARWGGGEARSRWKETLLKKRARGEKSTWCLSVYGDACRRIGAWYWQYVIAFFYVQSANERLYNKARKSEITTRMKKVFMNAQALMAADSCSESDISSLEKLISEATKSVDKAVARGTLHKNTGARRKARMSKYKMDVRVAKGLYTA